MTQDKKKENSLNWKRQRFLEMYKKYHAVGKAAECAGVSRRQVYRWIEKSTRFAEDFEDAKKQIIEALEMEADRRALEGVTKPLVNRGFIVRDEDGEKVTVTDYSDTLLIFRLKALDPEKYRERHEVTGPDGGPIQITEVVVHHDDGS